MRELRQIESLSDHACQQPAVERWNVLEPISSHWAWLTVFACCSQVVIEAEADEADTVQRAA